MSPQPIAANHPDYAAGAKKWRRCRDACAGSDAIKAAGVEYLPALSSHKVDLAHQGDGRGRYEAYLRRALWFNMARRSKLGLSGVVTMRAPKIETTSEQAAKFAKVVSRLRFKVVDEQLEVSRGVLVVNQKGKNAPLPSFFWADAIVNWEFEYVDGQDANGEEQYRLVMLVIEDDESEKVNDFESKPVLVRHAYLMVGDAPDKRVCHYTKWTRAQDSDVWVERTEGLQPVKSMGGKPLDHIPAIVVGATTVNEPDIEDPPLLDLVDVNISHYQNSADLEHGRHWTALPTAVAVGFPLKDEHQKPVELNVGGESAWMTENPDAKAFYLEFAGAGLGHIADGMKEKQKMAAVLGARLLEEQKDAVEAAETIKTRHAGERSVLSRIAAACSEALTWCLREMLLFAQPGYVVKEGQDTITLATDFLNKKLTPEELTSLTDALQAGGISYSTYFSLLQGAEIIPEGRTEEEEAELIGEGLPGKGGADPFVTEPPKPKGEKPDAEGEGEDEGDEEDGAEDAEQPEEEAAIK